MNVNQLEKFLHFFGKDDCLLLITKSLENNGDGFNYESLKEKYRGVIVRLVVSKYNGNYRPTEFPRENQTDNAFAIKIKDWKEKGISTYIIFKGAIEDRINKKKAKNELSSAKKEQTSLCDVKKSIENYLLSEAPIEVMESVIPLLKVVDKIELQRKLKKLTYDNFLKTSYWAHTRYEKLLKIGFKCQLCGAKTKTPNIHHNSYQHHGREMEYLDDLIVLCPECYKNFHKK